MKRWFIIVGLFLAGAAVRAQSFELLDRQDNYQTSVSETLRIPIHIRNTTEKAQFYIVRKVQSDLGLTQKGYFCLDKNCLEPDMVEFSKRIEAGETLSTLYYTLETGLVTGQNSLKFEVFARGNQKETVEHQVNVIIEERGAKAVLFQSKDITINEIYPNPVVDQAIVDYKIHNESLKAKILLHNILGKSMGDYELPVFETRIKILADELAAGVYFYTLYLDNSGVLTRKLIVRK